MKFKIFGSAASTRGPSDTPAQPGQVDFQDPELVLSVLEADQVVAAKRRTRFGRRKLTRGTQAVMWGLRVYVVVMLVIVFVSVLRALHAHL